MFKKTISYEDYDGNPVTEDFYFNMNEAEITEFRYGENGDLQDLIKEIIATKDYHGIVLLVKKLIKATYGKKSADGKRFSKREEDYQAFVESPAYPILFAQLASDDKFCAEFIRGIVPTKFASEVEKSIAEQKPQELLN